MPPADIDGAHAVDAAADDLLLLQLVRVVNLAGRPFAQRVGREHRLTLPEWRVMAVVARLPGCTASQVCEQCGMDKMAVSRALGSLQRAQRVDRCADPDDQRCNRLYLSEAGRALHAVVHEAARHREAELFEGMVPAEREQLAAALEKMLAAMARVDH